MMAKSADDEQAWAIDNDWAEDEQRQYERYSADFYLRIYRQADGGVFGDVVDISLGGVKVLGQAMPLAGQIMPLRMEASMESGQRASCEFQARVAWSSPDPDAGGVIAGLEFLALSPSALDTLATIIVELSG